MNPWAVVPIKGLSQAKTRLSGAISLQQRQELTLWMLDRVLAALLGSGRIRPVYVITPDSQVAARASVTGVVVLTQRTQGLNPALVEARGLADQEGGSSGLIVLGDLPLLSVQDVEGMLACAERSDSSVIAPDRHSLGTNLLLLRGGTQMPVLFGRDSYQSHLAAARARGLRLCTYQSDGTSFDVDTPDDLLVLRAAVSIRGEFRESGSLPLPFGFLRSDEEG